MPAHEILVLMAQTLCLTLNLHSQLPSGAVCLRFSPSLNQVFTINTTVKPVLSGNSKEDQNQVFKTDNRLMQVKSIAECYGAFCNTFDLLTCIKLPHGFKTFVLSILSGCLR